MANSLNLAVNVPIPNITKLKVAKVTSIDEDAKRLVVEIDAQVSGGIFYKSFALEVLNGSCGCIVAHPAPGGVGDVLTQVSITGAGVTTAFDVVLAAYQAAGSDKRGNVLTAMKAISAVTTSALFAPSTTLPALPAGTVP